MIDLSRRSTQAERIDLTPPMGSALATMHRELSVINRALGGVSTSRRLIVPRLRGLRTATVLDVGAGGGDLPRAIVEWGRSHGTRVGVISLDLNRHACRDATPADEEGHYGVCATAFQLPLADRSVDIVHAALFLHHFRESAIVDLVREMHRIARLGVVINDLHRHPIAYGAIRALTQGLSRSEFIKHDAPLSVRRGFTRRELADLLQEVNAAATVSWRWAFRFAGWVPVEGDHVVT